MEERSQTVHLPRHIKPNDAYGIFSLFFDEQILAILAQNTNLYAFIQDAKLQTKRPDTKNARLPWEDTSIPELRAYLGVLSYRSIHLEADRSDYWTTDSNLANHQSIYGAIACTRFDRLEPTFYLAPPKDPKQKKKTSLFNKLEPLNSHLLSANKKFWHPSSELAVDKFMVRFTDCAKEIVIIPSKSIPTGIKG